MDVPNKAHCNLIHADKIDVPNKAHCNLMHADKMDVTNEAHCNLMHADKMDVPNEASLVKSTTYVLPILPNHCFARLGCFVFSPPRPFGFYNITIEPT